MATLQEINLTLPSQMPTPLPQPMAKKKALLASPHQRSFTPALSRNARPLEHLPNPKKEDKSHDVDPEIEPTIYPQPHNRTSSRKQSHHLQGIPTLHRELPLLQRRLLSYRNQLSATLPTTSVTPHPKDQPQDRTSFTHSLPTHLLERQLLAKELPLPPLEPPDYPSTAHHSPQPPSLDPYQQGSRSWARPYEDSSLMLGSVRHHAPIAPRPKKYTLTPIPASSHVASRPSSEAPVNTLIPFLERILQEIRSLPRQLRSDQDRHYW